jgi:hypothetical protein
LISIQVAETLERNTFNTLMGFTQFNTVNSRTARASIVAGDVLGIVDLQRCTSQLGALGAYKWNGTEDVNPKIDAHKDADESSRKMPSPHFLFICHEFVVADLRMNQQFVQAASYSDINKLYNSEAGQWAGNRVVSSNMVPTFTGQAQINGTAVSGGSLASGTYYIQVTLTDPITQYETIISQKSTQLTASSNGAITVILPASAYLYNVYITAVGSATVTNLALCPQGPTSGVMQGQAVQLAGGQTVTLTGIGVAQLPPAAPATGVTVYPSWCIAKYAYSQIVLDEVQIEFLDKADKSDPHNQLREVSWKVFYGTLLDNNLFAIRVESTSAFSSTFA